MFTILYDCTSSFPAPPIVHTASIQGKIVVAAASHDSMQYIIAIDFQLGAVVSSTELEVAGRDEGGGERWNSGRLCGF